MAQGRTLVSIEDIDRPGVRRAVFVVSEPVAVSVEAVGVADEDGERFTVYGWIVDLTRRQLVWAQPEVRGEWDRRSENWRTRDRIELPAGTYGAYFSAHGGRLPVSKRIEFFGIPLGRFEMSHGPHNEWDDVGDPGAWGIRIDALDADFEPAPVPSHGWESFSNAIVRYVGLGDGEYRQIRLNVDRDVELELWATGEYSERDEFFADGAWIIDLATGERVWELTLENTDHAGGAEKNRVFDERVLLREGSYLLTVATDLSHSSREWNMNPPWHPELWGAALTPVDADDRDAVEIEEGSLDVKPEVAILRVGNYAFYREPFYVTADTKVLVRALGEQDLRRRYRFVDFGWIEDQSDLSEVWWMDGSRSHPAGGARKNRLVEEIVALPEGDYYLCYTTDDSHAYDSWNAEPPFDPEAWGISLREVDDGDHVVTGAREGSPAVVSLAPVGDKEHVIKRFETTAPTRVRVIAVGEGRDGRMFDYGWIENMETGEVLWEMVYDDTRRAGGARKNRYLETTMKLLSGRYAVHFVSDGSHSFTGWNDDPPERPHLWGVTLVEMLGN